MKIRKVERIDDCVGSDVIYRYFFDILITEYHLQKLSKLGYLDYYRDFSKPFFIIKTYNGIIIKGVLNENMLEVVFLKNKLKKSKLELNKFLEKI